MLPPLHKLGPRAVARAHAGDEEQPTSMDAEMLDLNRRFEDLQPELREHIFELLSDDDDPCQRDTQRACHNAATWEMHAWCTNHFDQLCHNPPNVVLQNQPSPFIGAVGRQGFLCRGVANGNDGYNPYDKSQMQWRQQFALFCNIVYGMDQWTSTLVGHTLATRRQVFDALCILDDRMVQFPPWSTPTFTVFKGLGCLDIDYLPKSVTTISEEAFHGCTGITAMRLQEGLKYIGPKAFAHSGLKAIDLPNSVATIQEDAFAQCQRLQRVTLPDNNVFVEVKIRLFAKCDALEHIDIPRNVKSIGRHAFDHCQNLRTVVYHPHDGREVRSLNIGICAFAWCTSLLELTPPSVIALYINPYAFARCSLLERVRGRIRRLGKDAFAGCTKLRHFEFVPSVGGHGLTEIGNYCFHECSSLEEIEIPHTVQRIGILAFYGCKALRSVRFARGPNDEPPSIVEIFERAFKGCESLAELELPASLATFSSEGFPNMAIITVAPRPEGADQIRWLE